jgi:hypothetical protein
MLIITKDPEQIPVIMNLINSYLYKTNDFDYDFSV